MKKRRTASRRVTKRRPKSDYFSWLPNEILDLILWYAFSANYESYDNLSFYIEVIELHAYKYQGFTSLLLVCQRFFKCALSVWNRYLLYRKNSLEEECERIRNTFVPAQWNYFSDIECFSPLSNSSFDCETIATEVEWTHAVSNIEAQELLPNQGHKENERLALLHRKKEWRGLRDEKEKTFHNHTSAQAIPHFSISKYKRWHR